MKTDRTGRIGPEPVYGHPSPGMHIWGWMSPIELDWLTTTASTMDSVVEVGSLHGRSAFALLTGCPGPVYCIDPWDDPAGQAQRSFLRNCGHFANLRGRQGRSPDVAPHIPDVDMVFLDGAHDFPSVLTDIRTWLPKTRKLLCGHDFNHPGYPDVRTAVDLFFGDRIRPAVGDTWDDGAMSIWVYDVTEHA